MVLEFWFERKSVLPSALEIFSQAILFVSLAVAGTFLVGVGQAQWSFLFLVGLPSIPFLLKVFQCEVEVEESKGKAMGAGILSRHYLAIKVLAAFFLGLVVAFSFWYSVLPANDAKSLFGLQQEELKNIRNSFQGYALAGEQVFESIFTHNLAVLLFIVLFSVVYGAGAIFILIWNASVIGVFLVEFARLYAENSGTITTGATGGLLAGLGTGFLGILPHGIFELLSYLTAAMAGGILSSAVVRGDFRKPIFMHIVYDIAKLLGWAIVFLAFGAFIESYPSFSFT